MSSKRSSRLLTKRERKRLRNDPAAKAVRARKAALPYYRAAAQVREIVDAGTLPPGCAAVAEAMARCHEQHGGGVRDKPLLIGYGTHGDREREAARARSRAEPPVFVGLSNETGLSRRWVIQCVLMLVATGLYRRWWGGPNADPRENLQQVDQRANAAGERREHVQGIGGTGMANAYTVDGIADPFDDEPPPEPEPPPEQPTPPPARAREWIRQMCEQLARDNLERMRRKLGEQEQQRLGQEARGP